MNVDSLSLLSQIITLKNNITTNSTTLNAEDQAQIVAYNNIGNAVLVLLANQFK